MWTWFLGRSGLDNYIQLFAIIRKEPGNRTDI